MHIKRRLAVISIAIARVNTVQVGIYHRRDALVCLGSMAPPFPAARRCHLNNNYNFQLVYMYVCVYTYIQGVSG